MMNKYCSGLSSVVLFLGAITASAQTPLVPAGAVWKYLDDGTSPAGWTALDFPESGWGAGPAELGYNTDNTEPAEATQVGYGPSATSKYITTYFRHVFEVGDPSLFSSLRMRLQRDDGAVVYLNGTEVHRANMPTGEISSTSLALAAVAGTDESTFFQTDLSNGLIAGSNVLAVEIHQSAASSSDLSFNLELLGMTAPAAPTVTRGPYLQNAATSPAGISAMSIRWRTDIPAPHKVTFGTEVASLSSTVEVAGTGTEHEVRLTGLLPDTQYFYSVTGAPSGDQDHTFFTPPVPGTRAPFRVWVLGDSGTANADAVRVKQAYAQATGSLYTDMWLMLGDNAYQNGTDDEFQRAVFNMYPEYLRRSPMWSTLGNHEYYTASGAPYFAIHTFPTQGEAGGAASGTEKYYSFDYGNVHFICLDSMSSDRSATGTMAQWLHEDLESTTQDWIIAFWHHPPYSKGSHDSDNSTGSDIQLLEMRKNFLPLLESGGVDLVLGGHSHSYERSYFIDGHYGLSSTFTPGTMIKSPGNGGTDGSYTKPLLLPANQGAVYAVAGSSGKATNWWGGSTALVNPNPHPAMVVSLLKLGSIALNFDGRRLDAEFLSPGLNAGDPPQIADRFTIHKEETAVITSPAPGAIFDQPASIGISATATAYDAPIVRMEFLDGATLIGVDDTAPYSITWTGMASGSHSLTAVAIRENLEPITSPPVSITVREVLAIPAAPDNLTAAAVSKSRVDLAWNDNSGNEKGFYIDRSTSANFTKGVTRLTVGPDARSFSNTALKAATTYYFRIQAFNDAGKSAFTPTVSAKTPSR